MNRRNRLALVSSVIMVIVLVAVALIAACAAPISPPSPSPSQSPPPAQEVYKWRVQTSFAVAQTEELIRPWLDEVVAATGGRLQFELYAGDQLVPGEQVIQALQEGTLDMCQGVVDQMAVPVDIAPLDAAPAFAWWSPLEIMTLWYERGLKDIYIEAYEELGDIHYVGAFTTDPSHILSSKPIRKYDDFKGLKLSTYENLGYPFLQAGVTCVNVPFEEFYLAGQTGVLDAILWCGATEGHGSSWHEVYPYFLTNPVNGAWLVWYIASADSWNNLPPDLQATLTMSMKSLALRSMTYYYDGECKNRGVFNLITMPQEDWAKFEKAALERWDEYATRSPRLAEVVRIVKEYNAEVEAAEWWR